MMIRVDLLVLLFENLILAPQSDLRNFAEHKKPGVICMNNLDDLAEKPEWMEKVQLSAWMVWCSSSIIAIHHSIGWGAENRYSLTAIKQLLPISSVIQCRPACKWEESVRLNWNCPKSRIIRNRNEVWCWARDVAEDNYEDDAECRQCDAALWN